MTDEPKTPKETPTAGSVCSARLGRIVGVAAWNQEAASPRSPDSFESDEDGFYHFPCGMCIHRSSVDGPCKGCRHWVA